MTRVAQEKISTPTMKPIKTIKLIKTADPLRLLRTLKMQNGP